MITEEQAQRNDLRIYIFDMNPSLGDRLLGYYYNDLIKKRNQTNFDKDAFIGNLSRNFVSKAITQYNNDPKNKNWPKITLTPEGKLIAAESYYKIIENRVISNERIRNNPSIFQRIVKGSKTAYKIGNKTLKYMENMGERFEEIDKKPRAVTKKKTTGKKKQPKKKTRSSK